MSQAITAEEQVVLVNERDEAIGTMGKLRAHQEGALHRAFSVFLFDDQGRLLLQQRAAGKYHSAGLWTNTCCSHPRAHESIADAARRRLQEEMGIAAEMEQRFSFIYRAALDNGLQEHELDHVLFGRFTGSVTPDPSEVDNWKYVSPEALDEDLRNHPERYTVWLRECWQRVREELAGQTA
ncbi:MAG TPA: isopentenyl-diphosphate Delta-isomerase [Flavobacteriales bacterium]|nr:isopentenyl-diphosphate Delta-isomerase [Flavobacteriales bacterium]